LKEFSLTYERRQMQRQQSSVKRFQYRRGWLCFWWLVLSVTATAQSWPQWGGPLNGSLV